MAGGCSMAYRTDEYHGYGCKITDGPCEFMFPSSKACNEIFGEGPDSVTEDEEDNDE